MKKYPWLQSQINKWQQLICHNKAPHAILISGAKGLAKIELANGMAHIALCEELSDSGVCNTCKGCLLFNAGNHTDLTRIAAEKSVIKVDQIRKLSSDVTLTSTRNHYKVIIIENAEQMNAASANALLKTLEEPPPKVIIILTTNDITYLLATIKSRCFKLNINVPLQQEAVDWLGKETTNSASQIDLALSLANGIPVFAKTILDNNLDEVVKQMLMDLENLKSQQKNILEISKNWMTDNKFDNLMLVAFYFMGLLKHRNSICLNHAFKDFSHVNFNNSKDLDVKLLTFVRHIYTFMNQKEKALKTELLLEELLMDFKNKFQ